MKIIALLFAFVTMGVTSAEAKVQCKLPFYIQAVHAPTEGAANAAESLFLYGLESAVKLNQGCVVDKMADAHLDLFVTTVKLLNGDGQSDASVVSVALAVPLNGIPVYLDNYVMVVRDSAGVDGQVSDLLQNIGDTLDRQSALRR